MDFDGIDMQHMLKIADPDTHKKFLKNLPPKVQGRTHALLGFEQDAKVLRDECEKETTALMEKYTELFKPLFEERSKIIAGEVAVTSEMVKEGGDFMLKKARNLAEEGETVEMTVPTTVNDEEVKKGIPNFWGTVLENALSEQDMIEEWDVELLGHLTNISSEEDAGGFRLFFDFSKNEYFSNTRLIKSYKLTSHDGDVDVEEIHGDEINWLAGKDLTQEKKKKKKKGSDKGQVQMVPRSSFFHFFAEFEEEEDEDEQKKEGDFEFGMMIKESIIPKAVEYFCNEHEEDDDVSSDEEGEDISDDDDDSDDEPQQKRKKGKGAAKGGDEPQQDCKQQ